MNDHRPDSRDPIDHFGTTGHIEEWEHLALDLLAGTLPPAAKAALDSHVERCTRCRESLDEQRRIWELLSATPLIDPPARIARHVLRAKHPSSDPYPLAERARTPRRRSLVRTWLPAAAVLLVTIGAVATYQQAFPRGGEADMAVKSETTVAAESLEAGAAMSLAPAGEPTSTTAAAGQTATTAQASDVERRLSVSAYVNALPPESGEDPPVVLLTMPGAGVDSSLADSVQAVTGLSPLQTVGSSESLATFAARVDRTEIDALISLLGEPGLTVFRFVDRASEMAPSVMSLLGNDPSAFPWIAATPGEGGRFAPLEPASDSSALEGGDYVFVVITSSDGR